MKLLQNFEDILEYKTFKKVERINKGWSDDEKYYIETIDDDKILLRVADISKYDSKKEEFDMMKQVAALGVPMSQPISFGMCNNKKCVYTLLSWCDGNDAEIVLPTLPEMEQYTLGIKSGEILSQIHSISAPDKQEMWSTYFNRKTNLKIEKYKECGLHFIGDERVLEYIEKNRYLLDNRYQTYQHGDYHVGNMIINNKKDLLIIDFNRSDFGDPWEEFNRIVWSATISPYFATGQLNGYFKGKPPLEFFKLLALYISSNTLSSIYWSIQFGQDEVNIMINQSQDVLMWFDNMKNPIPSWYIEDFHI